ncbi:ASI1-immunoprecipitated protein 1-like protein [Drosera capensis]
MDPEAMKKYDEFLARVKRTIYLDNLSPQVTETVIKTAVAQFGTATKVQFIPNYLELSNPACCALVELENEVQAKSVVEVLASFAFMMLGMPRPVRARPAEVEMFVDRPVRPGRKIHLYWVDPSNPDFEVAQKLKDLTKKHYAEASYLLKLQLEEEEKLSKQQAETLKTSHQKYEMIDTILGDGTAKRLADHYRVNLADDGYGHF